MNFFKIIFFILLVLPGLPSPVAGKIRITEQSAAELILTYETSEIEWHSDRDCRTLHLAGHGETGLSGYPALPFESIMLQVPHAGEFRVEVLENHFETLPDISICPVPRLSLNDDGTILTETSPDPAAYAMTSFYPDAPAEMGKREIFRGTPVARLNLYPFRWNPASKQLRRSMKMRLRVWFETPDPLLPLNNSPSFADSGNFDSIKRQILPNYTPADDQSVEQVLVSSVRSSAGPEETAGARIDILQEGIYQITYTDLVSAGISLDGVDPSTFRLFNKGEEIAIMVQTSGSSFSAGDTILFYGRNLATMYTNTNVYQLAWGRTAGKRMADIDATPAGAPSLGHFTETINFEESHVIWTGMAQGWEGDHWFWSRMTAPASTQFTIDLPSPVENQTGAEIRVFLHGRTLTGHHAKVWLNGTLLGEGAWEGNAPYVLTAAIPAGVITGASGNTLKVETLLDEGVTVSTVYLNRVEVSYERLPESVHNELAFLSGGESAMTRTVSGFTGPDIIIFDISDPLEVRRVINGQVSADESTWNVAFQDPASGEKQYWVTGKTGMTPERVAAWAELEEEGDGADYILITSGLLMSSLQPLCEHRRARGLRVRAVELEKIFNRFSYGIFDPAAIRDFLAYAYETWPRPAPAYVLLAGDANIDYLDHTGTGKKNTAPLHLSDTTDLGPTPDDNWYVCLEGDDRLPEMFIGRIPGATPEMTAGIAAKIIAYETDGAGPQKVLMVADNNETAYETINDEMAALLPVWLGKDQVYLSTYGTTDEATRDILSAIDQGVSLVNYVGHGSMTNWAGEYLIQSSDVAGLTEGHPLPLIFSLNCLSGYYALLDQYCLAEEFLAPGDKGAIGFFSPSGLARLEDIHILDREIFSTLFHAHEYIQGRIAALAKIRAYADGADVDILTMFNLIGDPATRLSIAVTPGDVNGDGGVDLEDLILGLEIQAGYDAAGVHITADVNADGRISGAEAVYILQTISGQ